MEQQRARRRLWLRRLFFFAVRRPRMADGADLPRGGADGRQCRFASRWCGWPTGADLPRGRLLLAGDEDMLEKSVHRLVDPRRPLAAGNSTRWRAPWTLFLVLSFWQSYSVCCGGGRR